MTTATNRRTYERGDHLRLTNGDREVVVQLTVREAAIARHVHAAAIRRENLLTKPPPAASRADDPETSKAAARDVELKIGSYYVRILLALNYRGRGTVNEIVRQTSDPPLRLNTASTRMRALREAGLVAYVYRTDSGEPLKAPTESGSKAHVYQITDKGRRELREYAGKRGGDLFDLAVRENVEVDGAAK